MSLRTLILGIGAGLMLYGASPVMAEDAVEEPTEEVVEKTNHQKALDELVTGMLGGDATLLDTNVEYIQPDPEIVGIVSGSPFESESGRLGWFQDNIQYFFVKDVEGKDNAVLYINGKRRLTREITPEQKESIYRLMNPKEHISPDFFNVEYDFASELDASIVDTLNDGLPADLRQDDTLMEKVRDNLSNAGENADELLKALEKLSRDSEHSDESVSAGLWYVAQMSDITSLDVSKKYMESEKPMGFAKLSDDKKMIEITPDLTTLTAPMFYENIHYAMIARHKFPWTASMDRDEFLETVVPIRAAQEPATPWRRHFFEAIAPLVEDAESLQDALFTINSLAHVVYRFEMSNSQWQDQSPYLSLVAHIGRCEEEGIFVSNMARATGINTEMTSTPFWADRDGNHAWISCEVGEEFLSIMPCETPERTDRYQKVGNEEPVSPVENAVKVFRRNLVRKEDITDRFTPVTDVTFENGTFVFHAGEKYYLDIINYAGWRSVDDEVATVDGLVFPDVGNRQPVLYAVSDTPGGFQGDPANVVYGPFLLEPTGEKRLLEPSSGSDWKHVPLDTLIDKKRVNDDSYALFHWDGEDFNHELTVPTFAGEDGINHLPAVSLYSDKPYILIRTNEKGDPVAIGSRPFVLDREKKELRSF